MSINVGDIKASRGSNDNAKPIVQLLALKSTIEFDSRL